MSQRPPATALAGLRVPPLDLSRPSADQIAVALKSAILDMQLEPGQPLSENDLAALFGASRTPVREALAQLRDDGLIVTRPSRRSAVAKLSERQIRGAQFLREALEVAVVERLCADGLSEAARTAVQDNLDQQARAVAASDKPAFQRLDDAFHALLASATGFELMAGLLIREKAPLDRLRVLALGDSARMPRLLAEHRAIFEAVGQGYSGQAADRMRRHLRAVLGSLSAMIAAHGHYFAPEEG